ncbi:MAG: esterase [Planctomycetes bacterium]|nr:esterase [Planctomycetota bacterium]
MNGTWSDIQAAGKTVEVYDPPGGKPRFGALFLHPLGLETLRGRPAYTNLLDKYNIGCLCPHAQRSWWVDRVCPEFDPVLTPEQHLLQNVVPIFADRWNLRTRSLGVFGISMGGQGAIRLALRHPQTFPACAGIASALDFYELYGEDSPLDDMYDSREQCRQDTAILHIHPANWPPHLFFCIDPGDQAWVRGNDRLHEKLTALGVPHTIDFETQAGGHCWPYFDRMADPALRFVYEGLEKESRRLL